jgi:hypothetical protein
MRLARDDGSARDDGVRLRLCVLSLSKDAGRAGCSGFAGLMVAIES